MYLSEFRVLIESRRDWTAERKGGPKMKVYPMMLMKTNGEKTPVLDHAIMFMKTKGLHCLCHDVNEKKGV